MTAARFNVRRTNNPMMAACWFGEMKAGCITVATMPLLRAKELKQIIDKASCAAALCDVRLDAEMKLAQAQCPHLERVVYFNDGGRGSLEAALARQAAALRNSDPAAQ